MQTEKELHKIKVNFALLKKSKTAELKKKAEDAILNQISMKVCRSQNQATERKKKRKNKAGKLSNIHITARGTNLEGV